MDVRRVVLDAAIEISSSEGPDAISMREVARRSGVSHQAPYHYFGDRAGIFAAIAEEGFTLLADTMSRALDRGGRPSSAGFESYLEIARDHPGHFRVMFRSDISGTATHEATKAAADRAFFAFERMVDETLARPVGIAEKAVWGSVMWSLVHGFAALLYDGPLAVKLPPGTDIERHVHAFNEFATSMVEAEARKVAAAQDERTAG